jgi:hypothetical protein
MAFDKATMRWIKREELPAGDSAKAPAKPDSASLRDAGRLGAGNGGGVDVVFDKKLMRWIPRSQAAPGSSGASKAAPPPPPKKAGGSKTIIREPSKPSPAGARAPAPAEKPPPGLGLPFVAVVPGKRRHASRRIEI